MKEKKNNKCLRMKVETSNRLEEMSKETGFTQAMIVQYLIDDLYINKYKKEDFVFNLFSK